MSLNSVGEIKPYVKKVELDEGNRKRDNGFNWIGDLRVKVLLTFDCEDFINDRSLLALQRILETLNRENLTGLFFLTGHMAEKISGFPKILELLEAEEIGYHSSSHSVRPTILEYTDIKDYELARQISMERETNHINPITGEPEGKGGIILLRKLFPSKEIISYRAPGFSFSPPHLEALYKLGMRFDFSTNLSPVPACYKDLTFYPYPRLFDVVNLRSYARIIKSLGKSHLAVLDFHPNYFVNLKYWDSIYFSGNPKNLYPIQGRNWNDIRMILRKFEIFLRQVSCFERRGILDNRLKLEKSRRKHKWNIRSVTKSYEDSIRWTKNYLKYEPRFILDHFMTFFGIPHAHMYDGVFLGKN